MSGARAKKRFGQHFLRSDRILTKIVELISPSPEDLIVEVGPGRGALTSPLVASGAQVVGIELDRDLIPALGKLFGNHNNFRLVERDVLTVDAASFDRPFKLVGNIPYNITSPLVDWLVRARERIVCSVLMVQREMALRLAGKPGSKEWSPLALLTQLHFDVESAFDVPPESFVPPPKVHSAVVRLRPSSSPDISDYEWFERVVRASFKQRRKLLINNLLELTGASSDRLRQLLHGLGVQENVRAEQVTTAQFLALSRELRLHRDETKEREEF